MKGLHLAYSFRLLSTGLALFILAGCLQGQMLTVLDEDGHHLAGVEVFTDDYIFGEITDSLGQVSLDGSDIWDIKHLESLCLTLSIWIMSWKCP